MKRILFLILLICNSSALLSAQNNNVEFEGQIKYNHKVIAKDSNFNVDYDYNGIGRKSEYFYKEGKYKFVNHDAYFKMDLFKSDELKNYLQISDSDTVLWLDARIPDFEVLEFDVKKSVDTILNYDCNVFTMKLKPIGKDNPISYRRYYFSEEFYVNPDHFEGCKGNGYDLIYEHIKSIPLRIEFEWPNRIIIFDAYKIDQMELENEIFDLDKKLVLKRIN
jgi:hypothetical protein